METPKKKGAWRLSEMAECLDLYLKSHDLFKMLMKAGNAKQFHDEMSKEMHVPSGQLKTLLKICNGTKTNHNNFQRT